MNWYFGDTSHLGVVLIRLGGRSRTFRADVVSAAFSTHGDEFIGAFTVVTPTGLRIRHLLPPANGTGT